MIVLNPPADPRHLELITRTPEHRAVETAIRIARVPFECVEATEATKWNSLLQDHGEDATFVLDLPVPLSIAVVCDRQAVDENDEAPMIVDGAQGVLELAALIAGIAGPCQPMPTTQPAPNVELGDCAAAAAATPVRVAVAD